MTLLQQTAWNLVEDLKKGVKKFNLLVKKIQVKMSLVMTLKVVVRCKLCDDLGGNSHDLSNMVTEGVINSQTESARHESSSRTRHFYVDVPNPEESNYDLNNQHITIDPEFQE